MGFEPTRGDPNGLAVHRLNHSATSSYTRRSYSSCFQHFDIIVFLLTSIKQMLVQMTNIYQVIKYMIKGVRSLIVDPLRYTITQRNILLIWYGDQQVYTDRQRCSCQLKFSYYYKIISCTYLLSVSLNHQVIRALAPSQLFPFY